MVYEYTEFSHTLYTRNKEIYLINIENNLVLVHSAICCIVGNTCNLDLVCMYIHICDASFIIVSIWEQIVDLYYFCTNKKSVFAKQLRTTYCI